jgi:hypothetical protein
MNEEPTLPGACCPPGAEGVTYLKVGPQQRIVGMMNLDMVFKQLLALGRQPDSVSDEEILGMARKFNYITNNPAARADYAGALRRAYDAFYARRGKAGKHSER